MSEDALRRQAEARRWLLEHDGTNPGDFLGYWCCPTCHEQGKHERVDMVRPASGDLILPCQECGTEWVIPMVQSKPRVLSEYDEV